MPGVHEEDQISTCLKVAAEAAGGRVLGRCGLWWFFVCYFFPWGFGISVWHGVGVVGG